MVTSTYEAFSMAVADEVAIGWVVGAVAVKVGVLPGVTSTYTTPAMPVAAKPTSPAFRVHTDNERHCAVPAPPLKVKPEIAVNPVVAGAPPAVGTVVALDSQ